MASSTTLRFPDPLKAEATAYADTLGVSLNALCAVALRDYLDARKAKPAALRDSVGPQAKRQSAPNVVPARGLTGLPSVPQVGTNLRPEDRRVGKGWVRTVRTR